MSEPLKIDVVVTGEQPVMIDGTEYAKGAAVSAVDCVSIRFLIAIGAIMAGKPARPERETPAPKPVKE